MRLPKRPLPPNNSLIPNEIRDRTKIITPRLLARPHRLHGDIIRISWEKEALHRGPKRAPLHGPREPIGIRVLGPDERRPVRLDRGVQFGALPGRDIPDGIHG